MSSKEYDAKKVEAPRDVLKQIVDDIMSDTEDVDNENVGVELKEDDKTKDDGSKPKDEEKNPEEKDTNSSAQDNDTNIKTPKIVLELINEDEIPIVGRTSSRRKIEANKKVTPKTPKKLVPLSKKKVEKDPLEIINESDIANEIFEDNPSSTDAVDPLQLTEEETLENIQTHVNLIKEKEITAEDRCLASTEIPQVMLDQLDLKRFPNLEIGKSKSSFPKDNASLKEELEKRIVNRKLKREAFQKNKVTPKDKEKFVKKVVTPKPRKIVLKPLSKKESKESELSTPKNSESSKKGVESSKSDSESEIELNLNSRPTRNRKLTDKYKIFVNQEKDLKKVLNDLEKADDSESIEPTKKVKKGSGTPLVKSKSTSGGQTPKSKNNTLSNEKKANAVKRKSAPVAIHLKSKKKIIDSSESKTNTPAKEKKMVTSARGRLRQETKNYIESGDEDESFEQADDSDADPNFDDGLSDKIESEDSDISDQEINEFVSSLLHEHSGRTIEDMVKNVFECMPSWNLHILPPSRTFCLAQVVKGSNGVPLLKKCIEFDSAFNVKVFVHQIHYKKYDGVYETEDRLTELLQLVDSM